MEQEHSKQITNQLAQLKKEFCRAQESPMAEGSGPFLFHDHEDCKGQRPQFYGKVLRVAAYIRVSTDSEKQEESYESQRRYFEGLLAEHADWLSAGIYSDYGISGTSQQGRTGFNRLLRHCREGRIDRIVTKSISRFSRNTRDFLKALEVLKEHDITIVFEKEHLDTAIEQNDLMITAFSAVAQEESRSISANIRWSIDKRRRRGEAPNVCIYGYRYAEGDHGEAIYDVTKGGYRLRRLVICQKEAAVVRRIFEEVAGGKRYMDVARGLNRDGIPAPLSSITRKRQQMPQAPIGSLKMGLDEGWTGRHIAQMIRLERYAGDVRMAKTYTENYKTHKMVINKGQRDQYYIQNHHPAIVDRELYETVQMVIRNNSARMGNRRKQREQYPFSRRLVCKYCGRFYRTCNRGAYPIWACGSVMTWSGKRVCSAERIYETQLVYMCRKAVMERYCLMDNAVNFELESKDFVEDLLQSLETVQLADTMEHDRSFLHMQIAKYVAEADPKVEELGRQLERMEHYWSDLEADYEWRQKAIAWMKQLPGGQEGVWQFLIGFEKYIRAFIFYIEVESPVKYRIRWFDDIWTDVEMLSNIRRGDCWQ